VFGYQIIVVYMLALALVLWWVMGRTPLGRYLHAIGGNREAARLAGVLYASFSGPALSYGNDFLLAGFAAVFLGSTQLKPGRFNVWGTVIAVYVLATGVKGVQLLTGVQWLNEMFNGATLIIAVAFAVWRQRPHRLRGRSLDDDHGANPSDSGSGREHQPARVPTS